MPSQTGDEQRGSAIEIAGERRLRQVICAFDLLGFLAIGALAFYFWRFWPKGHDVYSGLQQSASETYLLIWMGVALGGALAAFSRRTRALSFVLSFLLVMEGLSQVYVYFDIHRPYHPWARVILDRFEPHPLLGAIPRQSTFGGLSHDAMHRRTTINEGKAADANQVYVFGGSSTYDIAVIDSDTWASNLSRLLGPGYEVQNYGVPAYSSLEAMIQSLFAFRDVKPVCAVYYEGWNDLYNAHFENLPDDYSPSQALYVRSTLAVDYRSGTITNYWLFLQLIDRHLQQGHGYGRAIGKSSGDRDLRLEQIYAENISLIADLDRHFGVIPIFVPQILNYDLIDKHNPGSWPNIPGNAIRPLMEDLNQVLADAAKNAGAVFIDAPLSVTWESGDFVDEGHFTPSGAAKFAKAIAAGVAANCK